MLRLLATGLTYFIVMSGESYSGPFQPLSKDEHELRSLLEHHVSHLALQIGERNIWDYAALEATVAYIDDSFSELGYLPEIQAYQSQGKTVKNLVVERIGSTLPQEILVVGAVSGLT